MMIHEGRSGRSVGQSSSFFSASLLIIKKEDPSFFLVI